MSTSMLVTRGPFAVGVRCASRGNGGVTKWRPVGYPSAVSEHDEKHTNGGQSIRDVVLGMSDGLTVPFALAAGVSGAIASSAIVLSAGIAEIAAGAISMGLGGYLSSRSATEHYDSERLRELRETEQIPHLEKAEVATILRDYGLEGPVLTGAVDAIAADQEKWVDFMMRYELGLERPDERAAPRSAALVGGGYVVGGFFPLVPYALVGNVHVALLWSCAITSLALLAFGAGKARVLKAPVARGAVQALVIGGVAAAVAYGLARLIVHASAG